VAYAETQNTPLTVMTYNVLCTNTDATPIAANIITANPDLIAFQELTPLLAEQLEQSIGARYPYRTPLHPECEVEVAIWSRYPLYAERVDADLQCRVHPAMMNLDGNLVRVVDVHAVACINCFVRRRLPERIRGNLAEYTSLLEMMVFTTPNPKTLDHSFRQRQDQIERVLELIEGQPEPLVLLGDLNSTPMHEVYQALSAHLRDAFPRGDLDQGYTYPATKGRTYGIPHLGPMVRIDHIFHSDDWWSEAAWVAEWDGASDHRAVIARLRLITADGKP
jgi:endonuclease/exonuclease/phosphatase (EEP) superfamily protein YafD